MKYVTLSLLVVLALANVALADMTATISAPIDLDDPSDMLVAYIITTHGATGWANLAITDDQGELIPVHQCAPSWNLNTTWDTTLVNYAAAAVLPYDTHLIAPADVSKLTDVNSETNDGTNPGGLAAVPPVNTFGMGTFDARGTAFYILSSTPEPSYDILQVVVQKDQWFRVEGTMADSAGNEVPIDFVPEPGTILLLLAAVPCLLGLRRR